METTEKNAIAKTVQLTPFEQTKENLVALASDYKNMVVTKDNLKEANEARLVLYRERIAIQNTAKGNRKTIKDYLKNNNDLIEEELIKEIEPTELALEAKIKAIKDAIAEEERIEANRVAKQKAILDNLRKEMVEAANCNDKSILKAYEDTFLENLEEFQAEGEQLLNTLKETAKNRLEMLEFQAKKKADEELKAQDAELAKIALMENIGLAEMAFDADFEEQETKLPITWKDPSFSRKMEVCETTETVKIEPMKTVPIGTVSEEKPILDDKQVMDFFITKISNLGVDIESIPLLTQKAISHKEYLVNMLKKLAEQTTKVAEKL